MGDLSRAARIRPSSHSGAPAHYQRERRKLAERRKAAFGAEPTGPNQVWQLEFSEFETTSSGAWRLTGCRDYGSKYECPFRACSRRRTSSTRSTSHWPDYQVMFGHPMLGDCPVDRETGALLPVITIVTDIGGPFRSFPF